MDTHRPPRTRPARSVRSLLLLLTVLATACGGGGGGGLADPAVEALGVYKALLLGSAETSVVEPEARAAAILQLDSGGGLLFACAVPPGTVGDVIGAHIHQAPPGSDGPVVVDLLASATFDPVTGLAEGTLDIGADLAAEIAAAPGDFYVNVHTDAAPAGLTRGQIEPLGVLAAWTRMRGADEVVVEDSSAGGAATVAVDEDGVLAWRIAMSSPPATDILQAHIHRGAAGLDGAVFIDLEPAAASFDPATGVLGHSVPITWGQVARLCAEPHLFYVNVHTEIAPGGIARGQLGEAGFELWAPLSAEEETVAPSDPSARGGVTLQLRNPVDGTVHLAVPPAQGIDSLTGAHVHAGPAGSDGPILVDLMAGADFGTSPPSFSAEGSIDPGLDGFTRMLADPSSCYVNLHTAADPTGVARGQLGDAPVSFFAVLRGDEETSVVDSLAEGSLSLQVSAVFQSSFAIDMSRPESGDLIGGHVHDGPPGVDGPVLIDLLGGDGVSISGRFVTGSAPFTGRTFARLLAAPEAFYCNVHSEDAPAGIARGQLQRRDEDVAPAGLIYDSPVTYDEQTAIAENVPSSVGGAVASYAVSPPLPPGLVLDPVTGILSGTPTEIRAASDYTVTATNAAGSTTATLNITVAPILPAGLSYTTPVTYSVGTAIAPNVPASNGGTITSYSVSPSLPAGLTLGASTGVISGTPSSASGATNYTVTGSNSAGSTTATVNITVNAVLQPPSGLSYTTPVTYSTGTAITPNSPTVGGGAVATWSISPTLPAGLGFSTSSGVISGTPTSVTSAANYTVTAANAAGSTMATVNIAVVLGAPANLSYSNTPNIAYVNQAIQSMSPTSSGGAPTSYSITPALPAGLSLNTGTGVISGTPTSTSMFTTYTITATNSAGSTTATVDIVVY